VIIPEFKELRGKLVHLQAFGVSDITPEYISWLNDPVVTRYSNQRFVRHTAQSCLAYLESFSGTSNLFLSVKRLDDMLAVGTMTAYVSPQHETVDIGIMIGDRDMWGKGVGFDAWSSLVNWFHETVRCRKITAGTMRVNSAMMSLMDRSGMSLECVRPRQELLDGVPQDLCYFAKYRENL
jgi:ribosomal-protein-alanine N-acetyltransferase